MIAFLYQRSAIDMAPTTYARGVTALLSLTVAQSFARAQVSRLAWRESVLRRRSILVRTGRRFDRHAYCSRSALVVGDGDRVETGRGTAGDASAQVTVERAAPD